MKNVFVGFFEVPGVGLDSVETPLEGKPSEQYARLNALIRRKHPTCKQDIRRLGCVAEVRSDENPGYVELTPGMVLSQIFKGDADGECTRKIGRVFFQGAPFNIMLQFLRAQGAVTIVLRGVLRGDGDIRFGNKINPQRLATELPKLVEEVLGGEAKGLKLDLREVSPKPTE